MTELPHWLHVAYLLLTKHYAVWIGLSAGLGASALGRRGEPLNKRRLVAALLCALAAVVFCRDGIVGGLLMEGFVLVIVIALFLAPPRMPRKKV